MQDYFTDFADRLTQQLHADEIYLAWFSAEQSDFIRFNHAKIRQIGSVTQLYLKLNLIQGQRHTLGELALSGDLSEDIQRSQILLETLRTRLPHLPEDPYLLYATEICSTYDDSKNALPPSEDALTEFLSLAQNYDCVGLYASGGIFRGFANSLGQRNWQSRYTFNLDWSLYHDKDKAVKCNYAGFQWDNARLQRKMSDATKQLNLLKYPAKTIAPGRYPVYLAPAALHEIIELLNWGGFSVKSQRNKQSPLLKMFATPAHSLNPLISLTEQTEHGVAANFQEEGFIKPAAIPLIANGKYAESLISPRSAREFNLVSNGANAQETPESVGLAAGTLAVDDVLTKLNKGIYINNLWYLNYSDRPACRMTGMTRFATFWVENGEIIAPLNVMRFDETLYQMLGDNLQDLTQSRDFILDTSTYKERSTHSAYLPGALIHDFSFTL
jgi:predicted Zn-dependent protease